MMVTQGQLKSVFTYSPDTGLFIRLSTGGVVGSVNGSGYIVISIGKKILYAHRMAWLYMTGAMPRLVDHRDRDKSNNRWTNLRDATKAQNAANSSICYAASGLRGVYHQSNTNKWRAKLGRKHIGYFTTKEEAHSAYRKEHAKSYGAFSGV